MRRFLLLLALTLIACIARGEGDAKVVQKFDGTEVNVSTAAFTVGDQWEIAWFSPRPVNLTLLTADGHPVAGSHALGKGVMYLSRGGSYYIQINNNDPAQAQIKAPWELVVAEIASGTHLNVPGINPILTMTTDGTYEPLTAALPPGTGNTTGLSPASPSMPGGAPAEWTNNAVATPFGTAASTTPAPAPAPALMPTSVPAATPAPAATGTETLSQDQAKAVVLIKGDKAEGTGFMIKTPNGPAVITNIHVIADNPNIKITTNTGAFVTVLSLKCASDRDLAMLAIQDAGYNYLEISPDISRIVQPGDAVVTPGNSEGGEVMLNTQGNVLGVGPERVEISNPIYHGNSGGPVFHPKSGKVLGVVTEAEEVDLSDDLDKTSFASRNSAIAGKMRYFALRLDTISNWIDVDARSFNAETAFLDQFEQQSERLDAYLNRSDNGAANTSGNAKIYLDDDKIMRAESDYKTSAGDGNDTAQQIESARSFIFELKNIADIHYQDIQDVDNFYPFDREKARREIAYRKALIGEIDSISNNVERVSHLPRTNN